jgi:AraC family transcriptional regulator
VRIEISERQPVRVACLRYSGPYGEALGRFWRVTVALWLAENGVLDCPRYGVTLDNPMNTPPDQCRYDACVEIPRGMTLPGAEEVTIPGGRYAVTHFKGTGADIGNAWGEFVGVALRGTGSRADPSRNVIEHYPRGAYFDPKTRVFSCELCLPIGN